jgi:hypothetical protein
VYTAEAASLAAARAEYERLNRDARALAKMIDGVPPGKLEQLRSRLALDRYHGTKVPIDA